MSVETYSGQVYTAIDWDDIPVILSEGAALLEDHTQASVVSATDETSGGIRTCTILIHGGGSRYFRMQSVYNSGDLSGSVAFSSGRMENGVFVASRTTTPEHLNLLAGDTSYEKGASLTVVNGGTVWDLRIQLYGQWNDGLMRRAYYASHLRCGELVSGLDDSKRYTGGAFTTSERGAAATPYPSADYAPVGGADYAMGWTNPVDSQYSVPVGKLMLFPSLITLGIQNNLGVPTLGGKTAYFMTGQAAIPLNAYTEFLVDGTPYVSLGYLAIRST